MSDLISRETAIAAIEQARQAFALPDDVPGSRMVNAGFAAARGALEKVPSASEWVSVNDRLPPKVGAYLVCESDGNMETADYHAAVNTSGNFYRYFRGQTDLIADVTHWMELPAPPVD